MIPYRRPPTAGATVARLCYHRRTGGTEKLAQLLVGISKVNRYASRDSGDTVEVVERPSGGLSVVVADAQGTGVAAKLLSNLVTSKAVALLKEGARETAVHEAVHDHLYHYKGGKVSCTLSTLSVDTRLRRCTLTRNSPAPAFLVRDGELRRVDEHSRPLGIIPMLEPQHSSVPLTPGLWIVAVTDGVSGAGARTGRQADLGQEIIAHLSADASLEPGRLAQCILDDSVRRDQGRPTDDMTVVVVGVLDGDAGDERRSMGVRVSLRPDALCSEGETDGR
jgi:serine phosphatase RsbU (regulator of sigma subunit)